MELLHELLLSALIAIIFSFLIAKLVSMHMPSADSSRNPQTLNVLHNIVGDATEDIQHRDMLLVDRFLTEKRVEFVAQEEAQIVAKFVQESVEVEQIENPVKSDLVIEAESCELPDEIAEVISGSDVDEFQVSRQSGVNFPEEVFHEKEAGVDDHLVEEIMELSAEKNLIEESESQAKRIVDEKQIKIDSDDDDDWEGIERSELENIFAKATKFMEDEDFTSAGSDVQMELYGLHKIATEGPCREQAPMPLKVAARAKWNAWQRLGNMTPDVAMEQYVAIVSDNVPSWNEDQIVGDGKPEPLEVTTVGVVTSDKSIPSFNHPNYTEHSKCAEDISGAAKDDLTVGPIWEDLGKE